MKRAGLNWFKKSPEWEDEPSDCRYISERVYKGMRLVMHHYTNNPPRYEVELAVFDSEGFSEPYTFIATWQTFNAAAFGAVEWLTQARLKGEL